MMMLMMLMMMELMMMKELLLLFLPQDSQGQNSPCRRRGTDPWRQEEDWGEVMGEVQGEEEEEEEEGEEEDERKEGEEKRRDFTGPEPEIYGGESREMRTTAKEMGRRVIARSALRTGGRI